MLDEIRHLFRRSVDAFREEVSRRDPEDQVAALLAAMRKELVATRAAIPEAEANLGRVRGDLARERGALEECERRGAMAARIGDEETARIAADFADRHRDRVEVLEQKASVAEADLELLRREADAMLHRYKEADANRFAILAQLRREGARSRMRSAAEAGPFADLERMTERVESEAGYADALGDLGDLSAPEPDRAADRAAERGAVEQRLEELKRRMGRE